MHIRDILITNSPITESFWVRSNSYHETCKCHGASWSAALSSNTKLINYKFKTHIQGKESSMNKLKNYAAQTIRELQYN